MFFADTVRNTRASNQQPDLEWTYRLSGDLAEDLRCVDSVAPSLLNDLDSQTSHKIMLALRELVASAIEQGIVGTAREEKPLAFEHSRHEQLVALRCGHDAIQRRRATVRLRRDPRRITVELRGDGEGFGWSGLPDPNKPVNFVAAHGRGLRVCRQTFNEMHFDRSGNAVTAVKNLQVV